MIVDVHVLRPVAGHVALLSATLRTRQRPAFGERALRGFPLEHHQRQFRGSSVCGIGRTVIRTRWGCAPCLQIRHNGDGMLLRQSLVDRPPQAGPQAAAAILQQMVVGHARRAREIRIQIPGEIQHPPVFIDQNRLRGEPVQQMLLGQMRIVRPLPQRERGKIGGPVPRTRRRRDRESPPGRTASDRFADTAASAC